MIRAGVPCSVGMRVSLVWRRATKAHLSRAVGPRSECFGKGMHASAKAEPTSKSELDLKERVGIRFCITVGTYMITKLSKLKLTGQSSNVRIQGDHGK